MWFCSCDIVMILQIGVLGHYQAWHNYVLTRLIHGRDPCVFVCWKMPGSCACENKMCMWNSIGIMF